MRLGVGHAGDRLVDQQKLRLLRQQHADFEPLLLPMRQRAGKPVAHRGEADDVEKLADAPPLAVALAPHQRGAGAAVGLERKLDVVGDGVAVEHGRLLKLAADAEPRDLGLVEAREVVIAAVEHHVAGVGPGLAGDDVHHRRLAGAVRPDDRAHLARLDRERQVVERLEAVERHGDAVEIKQRGGEGVRHPFLIPPAAAAVAPSSAAADARSRRSAVQCRHVPTMPRGSSSVTATNRPPSTNSQ